MDDDAALLAAVSAGDVAAFGSSFTRWFLPLCAYANRYTSSASVAEEIVQDVFVNLWEMRGRLDVRVNLRNYLYVAVRNRALNWSRRERVAADAFHRLEPETSPAMSETPPTPDEQLHVEELARAAELAVRDLPPRTRQIFLMHREQGMTCAAIGAALSITPKTVENLLGRALKQLRVRLAPFLKE